MSAPETQRLIVGRTPVVTADYRMVYIEGPDIYGHVQHTGFRTRDWEITVGRTGEPEGWGTSSTRAGAWLAAKAAAHRPRPARAVVA